MKFKILLICLIFSACSTPKKEVKHDWNKIVVQLQEKFKTEQYPAPAGPLFTRETHDGSAQRWCFVGDSGYANRAQEQVAKVFIREGKCDRIYHLGDIVYPLGIKSADDSELQEKFLKYQAPFKRPYYLVMGNHEYFSLNANPWLEVAKQNPNLHFPHFYYGHNVGGVCVVALDSTPLDFAQPEDPKVRSQAEWMEGIIQNELKDCLFKILVAHHPYASPNKKRQPKKGTMDFYEKYVLGNFDLLISGHEHALAFMGKFKGTDQYISGAGGNFTARDDRSMDFLVYTGHRGPGILYLDIETFEPFKAKTIIKAFQDDEMTGTRMVAEKTYLKGDKKD